MPENRDSLTTPPFRWSVREEGNKVIMEFECRDNYEAIQVAENIAASMDEGHLEMEFHNDQA